MCNHHAPYADPVDPALPKSSMTLDLPRTALVVIDPQIDFMSPEGRSWGVVGESAMEQNLVANLVRLFKAAKQAGITVAGLDGIQSKRDPGERLDIDMYQDGHKVKRARKLPLNLLDAIRLTEKSDVVRKALGDDIVDSYVKLKQREWNEYCAHLTQWERDRTLDC